MFSGLSASVPGLAMSELDLILYSRFWLIRVRRGGGGANTQVFTPGGLNLGITPVISQNLSAKPYEDFIMTTDGHVELS